MRLIFKISKLDNLYFFVSNLTEFHFSCRKHFNKDWISADGDLSQKEKRAINDIKPIFKKYGFIVKNNRSLYLGKYFYCPSDKDKWDSVKEYLSPSEYKKFVDGFKILEPRFNRIYNEDLLKKWKAALEQELNSKRFIDLYNSTERFLRPKKDELFLNIHLLISPSLANTASGGANLGNKDITLEVPVFNLTAEQVELAAGILLHELAHIWFENNSNYATGKKLSGKNFSLIKEVIIDSISPSGFPSQLYSKNSDPFKWYLLHNIANGKESFESFKNNGKTDYQKLKAYMVWLIYPLVALYFLKKKKLDSEFIKAVIRVIKKRATR